MSLIREREENSMNLHLLLILISPEVIDILNGGGPEPDAAIVDWAVRVEEDVHAVGVVGVERAGQGIINANTALPHDLLIAGAATVTEDHNVVARRALNLKEDAEKVRETAELE